MAATEARTGYAPVGDLRLYYEIHGEGRPLVLLHGAYMTVDMMGALIAGFAPARQVIAIEQADVMGYSMGGGIALQLALRHPARVRKLVIASAGYRYDAMPPEAIAMFPSITPEMFKGSPMEEAYLRLAPDPDGFPTLVEKLTTLDTTDFAWPEDDIRALASPTMIVLGDSDGIRLEHAVELFKRRGGGVRGDFAGIPQAQLAVLPGTSHFVPPGSGLLDRSDWLLAMIPPFLDPLATAQRP